MKIPVTKPVWVLGDREQRDTPARIVRPLYYKGRRVGEIEAEAADRLIEALDRCGS